ncbi:MAG: choice-of-anchor V domain-containing protein [Pseudomonadota bacterium]
MTPCHRWLGVLACCAWFGIPTKTIAYPEGAPWGAADPTSDEHCASCHWEQDAVMASERVQVTGWPDHYAAGRRYAITVRLIEIDGAISGFQALLNSTDATSGRLMLPASPPPAMTPLEISPTGRGVRSISPQPLKDLIWSFDWQAPEQPNQCISLNVAISAANGDESPFGDVIHYRQLTSSICDSLNDKQ